MRPITIKQLAQEAGVSVASVSRALNGLPGVAAATKARIEALALELGYSPDSRARALVTGEVPFVGLVVPDITNPFYPEVARGAEQALLEQGYSLLLVSTDWRAERLERALGLLLSRHVAGLLIAVPLNGLLDDASLDWSRLGAATVVVGQELPRAASSLVSVNVDDRHGGYLVGKHLCGLGWRRLAVVAGPERDRTARARLAGFRRALAEVGQEHALAAVIHGEGWSVDSGHRAGLQLFDGKRPPDAVFAANDLLALGVARAAAERGRRLGRDLGLVGYDDIEPLRYLEVPLTSVSQPKLELGRRAAELLLDRIAGALAPRRRPRLRPQLVIRQSCGAAEKDKER